MTGLFCEAIMIVEMNASWWVYLIECGDGTLYCGIARNVEHRMREHATPRGSRYVRSHRGVKRVLWRQEMSSRSAAQKLEAWIKRQRRDVKLALSAGFLSAIG